MLTWFHSMLPRTMALLLCSRGNKGVKRRTQYVRVYVVVQSFLVHSQIDVIGMNEIQGIARWTTRTYNEWIYGLVPGLAIISGLFLNEVQFCGLFLPWTFLSVSLRLGHLGLEGRCLKWWKLSDTSLKKKIGLLRVTYQRILLIFIYIEELSSLCWGLKHVSTEIYDGVGLT